MPASPNATAPSHSAERTLILASTSRYRRELLERLRYPFRVVQPGVDEVELPGELPVVRAERLAIAKARAVANHERDALVIGSDQVAALDSIILDKPGGFDRAREQLRLVSGHAVEFFTAVALVDARTGAASARVIPYHVVFRTLNEHEIERYLRADEPYDCAASAKAESLGIALLEKMRGDDPTALIGLPLIALCELLRQHGVAVP